MSGGTLTPIEALTELLESGSTPALRTGLIDRFGDVIQLFEAKGWLKRAPTPSHTTCLLCNRGHEAELGFDAQAKVGRYCCVEAGGWGEVSMMELESRVLNLHLVLKHIRAALHPISFSIEERLPGLLWRLGESSCGGGRWTAMFARHVYNDRLARCLAHLPHVSSVPGLVLTCSGAVAELGAIAGFRFAALSTVLNFDVDGHLSANAGALGVALGRPQARKPPPGRPTPRDEIFDIVCALGEAEAALGKGALLPIIRARLSPHAPPLKDKAFLGHIQSALRVRLKKTKT